MSFSDIDVVHPADAPSSHRKLLDRRISGHLQLQQRRSRKDGDHPLDRPGARMKYEDNFWEDRLRRRLYHPGPADLGEEAGARFLVGWALRLAPMQAKSSGSSRFLVNILTNLSLPRYVAFRFVVKVTQGNGRGGVQRLACVFEQHGSGVLPGEAIARIALFSQPASISDTEELA
ncbi:hypothetical protein Q8A73_019662 [Channa argus]|nr:hypothetical protein Q8A73_019662 [Channa argus]